MRLRSGEVLPRPSYLFVLACLLAVVVAPGTGPTEASTGSLSRVLGLFGLAIPVLAVAAAREARRPRIVASVLAVLTAVANADSSFGTRSVPPMVGIALALALLAYTSWLLLVSVVKSHEVTGDVIAGAMAAYLMIGLTWAVAYGLVEVARPGSIATATVAGAPEPLTLENLIYFSYMTLMTVGYGDMAPVARPARTLAVVEGFIGVAFTTIIMAVLVSVLVRARWTGNSAS